MSKVTVATVCYNSSKTLKKTMMSVLNQTYGDIEYLVIDGASTDATLDIIRSFSDDKRVKYISEPDEGLYDAMNKAANMATGQYIIYMNSGDVFASDSVVKKMMPYLDENNELVYGNVIRLKSGGKVLEKYNGRFSPILLLIQGKMMSHQVMFTRCDLMRSYGFRKEFPITADYDLLVRMVKDKRKLKYVDINVSIVDNIEGISSQVKNMDDMRRQDDMSLKESFPIIYCLVSPPKMIIRKFRRICERRI